MSTTSQESKASQRRRHDLLVRPDGLASTLSHRGNNDAGIPPNTVPAFLRAIDAGADWVEVDVQLSADGDLVVHHNVMHEGDEIRRLPTREVQRRGLATLAEIADAVPERIGLFLDVKHGLRDAPGEDEHDLFRAVTAWADDTATSRAVAVVSFCPTLLKPSTSVVSVGVSTHQTTPLYQALSSSALFDAPIVMVHADDILEFGDEYTDVEACVKAIDRFGVAVVAWEAKPDDVETLLQRGVTGVCGNDVPGLVAATKRYGPVRETSS
jgi:glycerophosphoryl diester phosphodiesterase